MFNPGIGQKALIIAVVIFLLFAAALSIVVGNSSSRDLTAVKQDELLRMSQILARRVVNMQENAAVTARSLEESEPMVKEIQLLTNLGPYYADPASYFGEDLVGVTIEQADQIYVFQAQLELVQLLQSAQRLNDLTSISFYLISPFDAISDAPPTLALHLDQERIVVARFREKGYATTRTLYGISVDQFQPPAPDYFDISTAYSAPPGQFYTEQNFESVSLIDFEIFGQDWQENAPPRSDVVIRDNVPVLQTWYPVKAPVADPETWEEKRVPVGLVLIEQELDAQLLTALKNQLGLDVGFAQGDQLLITSLDGEGGTGILAPTLEHQILELAPGDFYYAREPIPISHQPETGLTEPTSALQAVVLSPVAEVQRLTERLLVRILLVAGIGVIVSGTLTYAGIRYLIGRPLKVLTRGVERISAGDLAHAVPVRSKDELGQLATAFNDMAARLQALIGSLEQRVAERTQELDQRAAELEASNRLNQRRATQLEASAQVARTIASVLDPDELLTQVVHLISDHFGHYHTGIFLLDESGRWAVLQAANSPGGQRMLTRGHQLEVGVKGIVGYAAQSGEPHIALDVGADAVYFDNPYLPDTRSEMALPLRARGQVLGILDVQSTKGNAFDEQDVAVLSILADQIAVALNNARLYEASQNALAQVQAVQRQYALEAWEEYGIQLEAGFFEYRPGEKKAGIQESDDGLTEAEQVLDQGRTVVETGDNGQKTTVAVPISTHGQVIGALGLEDPSAGRVWSEDEISLIETVAEQVAQAIESVRLLQETQRVARREQRVREIAAKLRSATDIDGILRTAVQEIRRALGVSYGVIRLGTETHLQPPEQKEKTQTAGHKGSEVGEGESVMDQGDNQDE